MSIEKVVSSRDSILPAREGHDRRTRGAADFISPAASDTVVCTKHLLRLELATTMRLGHQRGERQRLRGLETHLCPPAGRLKATGSGRAPVPVSTQLGGGAAHDSSSPRHAIRVSSEHGSPINAQDSGTFVPRCSPRSGPHVDPEHPLGLGPMLGPVRRPGSPVLLERVQSLGLALIVPPPHTPRRRRRAGGSRRGVHGCVGATRAA